MNAEKESDLISVAEALLNQNHDVRLWLLEGNLGAGKTALVKAFAALLGSKDKVCSPTFGLVNEYETENGNKVYHFDLYRCESERELLRIGIEEYFDSGAHCFVEWYELAETFIFEPYVKISLTALPDFSRTINATRYG